MYLHELSHLRSLVKKTKKLNVSIEDLERLRNKKVLVDFETRKDVESHLFPLYPNLHFACQVIDPTSIAHPKQSDFYGVRIWDYKCSQKLRHTHLLRFDSKMGLFINFDKFPAYLVQLILQELSPRYLQMYAQPTINNSSEELDIVSTKIGQFDVAVILPESYTTMAGSIINKIAEAFVPSLSPNVVFWFHGAKYQGLSPILTTLRYITCSKDMIMDIFAGSCTIASNLAWYRPTIANDVEIFSTEIAKALASELDDEILKDVFNRLRTYFEQNKKELEKTLRPHIEQEEQLLWGPITSSTVEKYQRLVDQYPIYSDDRIKWDLRENECVPWQQALEDIEKRQMDRKTFPYSLITYYFANAYFGLKQALELDSIRYSIDRVVDECEDDETSKALRSTLIAGLLSVASTMSSAPGHFAQYLRKFKVNKARRTWTKRREKLAWKMFLERVRFFIKKHPSHLIKVYNDDWHIALANCIDNLQNKNQNFTTVYADPPMSDFQYSRFYHVLNTICLYDYPKSQGRGLYRDDRFSSSFSLRGKAYAEMEDFIKSVSKAGKQLVLSYKPNGIIALQRLSSLMNKYYKQPMILSYEVLHSSQGKKRTKTHALTYEILFIGRQAKNPLHGNSVTTEF